MTVSISKAECGNNINSALWLPEIERIFVDSGQEKIL